MAALLADRMLEGLARRLRLMGYDCALLAGPFRSNEAILAHARGEGRTLLTTARGLHALAPGEVVLVPAESLAGQVREVLRRFPIDVARLAFTRCSRDNALLEELTFAQAEGQLPPLVRELRPDPIRRCPLCGRLYWPGTHVPRIEEAIQRHLTEAREE